MISVIQRAPTGVNGGSRRFVVDAPACQLINFFTSVATDSDRACQAMALKLQLVTVPLLQAITDRLLIEQGRSISTSIDRQIHQQQ